MYEVVSYYRRLCIHPSCKAEADFGVMQPGGSIQGPYCERHATHRAEALNGYEQFVERVYRPASTGEAHE